MAKALLVIDVQMAHIVARDAGYVWANPDAESQIAALIAAYRGRGVPVIHVVHHEKHPGSDFHADAPTARVMPCAMPLPGEVTFVKHGSSALIGTGLGDHLKTHAIDTLMMIGGEANFCVESTARMAGNLGYHTTVVADALINFARPLRDGRVMAADDVLALTLANLGDGYARIVDTVDALAETTSL